MYHPALFIICLQTRKPDHLLHQFALSTVSPFPEEPRTYNGMIERVRLG